MSVSYEIIIQVYYTTSIIEIKCGLYKIKNVKLIKSVNNYRNRCDVLLNIYYLYNSYIYVILYYTILQIVLY